MDSSNFLSSTRTQESFPYSATTPKSPDLDIRASNASAAASNRATENRFQNLISNPMRRSQLERLVAEEEDVNFESTQVDPCLEATQVDSPMAYASTQVRLCL